MDDAAIRETLNKALSKLNPNGIWPVNLHGILGRLGIALRYEAKEGRAESLLQLGTPPTVIVYRQSPSPVLTAKERFSIAHELAHWILWRRFDVLPSSENEYWWHETLCNEFAAGLLVPRKMLRSFLEKRYREGVDPVYFPRDVARCADVSWPVAAKSLGSESIADSAYLRLVRVTERNTSRVSIKVECSTLVNSPGSFVGRSARIGSELELYDYFVNLRIKKLERRAVTLSLGALHLKNVSCGLLREPSYWVLHFRRSDPGVELGVSPRRQSLPMEAQLA